ncbi:MAG: hypothetical protein KF835_14300 [Xanthobacteraceae bacterium]|nr:hypothetical protein [Xanthobacteraceae bacterium]MCW5675400.1 hypothetical protein [Xanthobacteraceae bacterium]
MTERGEELAAAIPNADRVILKADRVILKADRVILKAAHISAIEDVDGFAKAVKAFRAKLPQ